MLIARFLVIIDDGAGYIMRCIGNAPHFSRVWLLLLLLVGGRQVLRDHGQGLVQELVKCCVGELPSYSIDGDAGSVAGLLWRISRLCPAWLQVRLDQIDLA